MRILLDECVPRPTLRLLTGHQCQTVQECEWGGIKNGRLLALAESTFDLFLTADQGIRYQQNLAARRIAILELSTNKLRRINDAQELIQRAVADIKSGEYRRLEIP